MALRVNIPPATRVCLISLLTLSLLYNIARWRQLDITGKTSTSTGTPIISPIIPYLTLVPSQFIFYPWTLLTATFVEQNIFTVLLNASTLFYGGKYLERAWGSREFAKFIIAIAVIPNVAMCHPNLWRNLYSSSFLVAFKQLVPEHTVTIFKGLVKMRVKHFPAVFLLLNTLSGVILGTHVAALLSWFGLLTSWTYLRFFKRQPDLTGTSTDGLGIKGDASETFAFACLFPDIMQPPVAFISDIVYSALVSLKICTPFSAEEIASGNQQALARGEAGLPSLLGNHRGGSRTMAKREEAERRRAVALKALDQRLQAAVAGRTQPGAPQPGNSQTQTPTPAVAAGQSMLGETSYTPDHA
ncbi:rhomboid family protein [Aspergillus ochraceoroseus]|uniref:Rhomboid family protein n=1 Tax=Aspergillus ochraceoroseus TaxID=138278 RepID=A0A0F8VIK0_9EURO|nr:rhomboid family protein [Aspergillus ochraceoroseus]